MRIQRWSASVLLVALASLTADLAAADGTRPVAAAQRAEAASRSAAFRADDFDPATYAKDRAAYCAKVVPGRIWQLAQPGLEVPALRPATSRGQSVAPGGSVDLAVQAVPQAPVTFLSQGLGSFENGQVSITVQADATGRATASFTATPGTVAYADVMAACPLTSGQVMFTIEILAPTAAAEGASE
jgi:hypothetical protein